MLNRSKYWIDLIVKLIMVVLFLLLVIQLKAQQTRTNEAKNPVLFFLYTKNAITAYELNFDYNHQLDKGNPLKVSMQKLLRPSINRGIHSIKSRYIGSNQFEIRLTAYQKMPFYLLKSEADKTYKLYVKDGLEQFLLKRISLRLNRGSFKQPKYQYMDVVTPNEERF